MATAAFEGTAEKEYEINTGEKMQSWQRLLLAKFSRNLAVLDGRTGAGRL